MEILRTFLEEIKEKIASSILAKLICLAIVIVLCLTFFISINTDENSTIIISLKLPDGTTIELIRIPNTTKGPQKPSSDLSYTAVASSYYKPKYNHDLEYTAMMVVDGKRETAWNEGANGNGIGEWIQIAPSDGEKYTYSGFEIANGFQNYDYSKGERWTKNNRVKTLNVYDDNRNLVGSYDIMDKSNGYQTILFNSPVTTRYLKFEIADIWEGERFSEACISEIRPF